MLKFSGEWDYDSTWLPRRRALKYGRSEFDIPTVDEMDEFNRESELSTIKQILNGRCLYYGYDEQHPDNEFRPRKVYVSDIDTRSTEKVVRQELAFTQIKQKNAARSARQKARTLRFRLNAAVEKARKLRVKPSRHWIQEQFKEMDKQLEVIKATPRLSKRQLILVQALVASGWKEQKARETAMQYLR